MGGRNYSYEDADKAHFAVRTCNAYWNPQVTVSETNVDPFYLGMASQATEREDLIITPDLRGNVRKTLLRSEPVSIMHLAFNCYNY